MSPMGGGGREFVVTPKSRSKTPPFPRFTLEPRLRGSFFVRPAGRTHLEVKVLYTADMGKC